MLDVNSTPPIWINSSQKLQSILPDLARSPFLSIDTESNSLYVYREQVCLIQITTDANDYLIDPLALPNLTPLTTFFANPLQEKIFHASEYDIICLKRDFGFQFVNIFDTMIAARILGEEAVGLASLLQSRLGLELEKKYQRANWGIRPLSQSMLDYACQDSHSLYELRNIIAAELKEKDLWELALEDFRLACDVEANAANPAPKSCWKVAGSQTLDPCEAAILQELCEFREAQARRQNVPPFKILTNEVLVTLTKLHPTSADQMLEVHGITQKLINRFGFDLLQAVQRGETAPPLRKPKNSRPDERFLKRLESLREWRKLKGKELKVESDVILPRDFIELIAGENPASTSDLKSIMCSIPWRYQHFGLDILQVLRKQETE